MQELEKFFYIVKIFPAYTGKTTKKSCSVKIDRRINLQIKMDILKVFLFLR